MAKYSDEDKKKIIQSITDHMKDGISLRDASKNAGISDKTFYNWKASAKKSKKTKSVKKKSTPRVETFDLPHVPLMPPYKLMYLLYGTPDQIALIMKEMK